LCATIIVVNTVIIGMETQLATRHALGVQNASSFQKKLFNAFEIFFLAWMIFELLVNLCIQKWEFVSRKHLAWNVFEVVLIIFAILLQCISHASLSWGFLRIIRLILLWKIIRILRIVRYLRGIRNMMISLVACASQLVSACGVMVIFMYGVSLLLMQGLVSKVQEDTDAFEVGQIASHFWGPVDEETRQQTMRLYGSIDRTMMTLFMTISGGMEWSEAAKPVAKLDVKFCIIWLVYSAFMTFGLTNILVGIFVESALQAIQNDKHSRMTAEIENYSMFVACVRTIFNRADTDGDGFLCRDEFQFLLTNPDLVTKLKLLGIETQVEGLFRYLDQDKTADISFEEFEAGLWRIKGEASAVDMLMLMHEHRRTAKQISRLSHDLRHLRGSMLNPQHAVASTLGADEWPLPLDGCPRRAPGEIDCLVGTMCSSDVAGSRSELLDDAPWLAPWSVKPRA